MPNNNTPPAKPTDFAQQLADQGLKVLTEALETPPPPSVNLPESQQGNHNIPRLIAAGIQEEMLKFH